MTSARKHVIVPLSHDEVCLLIRACGRGFLGARDRAIIAFLYRSQLRAEELCSLLPEQVDLESGLIRLCGKGNKLRTSVIDATACRFVADWLSIRGYRNPPVGTRLFCTRHLKPLHRTQIWRLVRLVATRIGLEKRCYPHLFRHTGACEMAKEGFSGVEIQTQLGHASLGTTTHYLRGLAPLELLEGIRLRGWGDSVLKKPNPLK